MLNELLALYPKAQLGITTRNNTPYIWYRDADTCWSVTEGGYVSGFDLINEYTFDMKQFDDIKDVVSYIEEIVAGIGDTEE
jgi:hypothetical protein